MSPCDPSGFDPAPALKAADQPMIWLNGTADRQVPTAVNTEVLQSQGWLAKHLS
jgi:hypothetical protein